MRCGVAAPFLELREAAEQDTDARNRLETTAKFKLEHDGDTGFAVTRCGPHEACVRFTRTASPPRIRISGYGIPEDLEVRTVLNASGECDLVLGNDRTPIRRWRILDLALDALFFDDNTDHPR